MNDKAEKVYATAFFDLCMDEARDNMADTLKELETLDGIFAENPEFIKLMATPTIPVSEKTELISEIAQSGGISELVGNLLGVLAEKNRMGSFCGIVKCFRELYNDSFGIAEITVTVNAPLSDKLREEISAKMAKITGKTVSIKEKVDPAIMGGIVIDYGSTRYDGSVRARLSALKDELGSVI